jgi:hypothetical protein
MRGASGFGLKYSDRFHHTYLGSGVAPMLPK